MPLSTPPVALPGAPFGSGGRRLSQVDILRWGEGETGRPIGGGKAARVGFEGLEAMRDAAGETNSGLVSMESPRKLSGTLKVGPSSLASALASAGAASASGARGGSLAAFGSSQYSDVGSSSL